MESYVFFILSYERSRDIFYQSAQTFEKNVMKNSHFYFINAEKTDCLNSKEKDRSYFNLKAR